MITTKDSEKPTQNDSNYLINAVLHNYEWFYYV